MLLDELIPALTHEQVGCTCADAVGPLTRYE